MKGSKKLRILVFCANAVVFNVLLGSVATYMQLPFLYLDAIGTIFIATNFEMKYGIFTGICTNLLLGVIFGPLALPFGLVSIVIAVVSNLCSKSFSGKKQVIITGLLTALIGSAVSTPIRFVLYGGFSNSSTDGLIFMLKASGIKMLFASYFGAIFDNIVDKIISCWLVGQINQISILKRISSD